MRSTVLFAQLAAWATTTHAFYPFNPEWRKEEQEARRSIDGRSATGVTLDIKQRTSQSLESLPERAIREASRLLSKYDRRPSPPSPRSSITKRDNEYHIQEADESGDKLTAGISQDGTDYSYFVQVQVGSSGKELWMLIDTGAGSSWLMGSDCDTDACSLHDTFGSKDSTTLKDSSDNFSISYGSGTVKGSLVSDTISVAGMSFDYTFGLASETSDDFSNFAFDGILGLSMTEGVSENFLKAMDEADELESNIFCVALNRASDGTNTGEIRFGSTDKDKYTGDVTYTSVAKDDDWAIQLDDMAYDGKKAGVGGIPSYIDTGTSFIFGPPDAVKSLHSVIPGAKSTDNSTYSVPCDSKQALTFTFSGVDFEVSHKDWISPQNLQGQCTSNIYGFEVVEGAWLLGDTFLKNVYAVFDKDKKRIGFAPLVETVSTTSSTSTMSATATQTTSASASDSTSSFTTGITSAPDPATTTKPPLGLSGHESQGTTDTAAAQTATKTKDPENSASGGLDGTDHVCLLIAGMILALLV